MSKTVNCIVNEGRGLRAGGKQYGPKDKVALSEKDAERLSASGVVTIAKEKAAPAAKPDGDKADPKTEAPKA